MKQTLSKQQTLKQKFTFHSALYDSLDMLKLSGYELLESVFEALQNNPLLDIDYNPIFETSGFDIISGIASPYSLKEHLYLQLHTSNITYDDSICSYIIESLDTRGFFQESITEIAKLFHTSKEQIQQQLCIIQSFEPSGVAAKDCIEALKIQALKSNQNIAVEILNNKHSKQSLEQILKSAELPYSRKELEQAITFMKTLNPYPCSDFDTEHNHQVFPDVRITMEEQQLVLSPVSLFHIQYHDFYMDLLKDNKILKEYFEDSKVLLSNISKRNATMMLVMNEIVKQQSGYFLYQDELQSLTQQDIAKALGMNQTTVSRAVMNKYYEFESEIYPISHLFVSSTEHGDSSDAIKKAIRDIIAEEDKKKPYSDLQIVDKLKSYDYTVSRRTIAKYREACRIPSTKERRIK